MLSVVDIILLTSALGFTEHEGGSPWLGVKCGAELIKHWDWLELIKFQ